MCYDITRLLLTMQGARLLFKVLITISMEKDVFYLVDVFQPSSSLQISVFETALLDEACAFALSLYRSSNVSGLSIVVSHANTHESIIVFNK